MNLNRHVFFKYASIGFLSLFLIAGCGDPPSTGNNSAKSESVENKETNISSGTDQIKETIEKQETDSKKESTITAKDLQVPIKIVTPEEYKKELEKYKGKVVLVDFWATWCVNCIRAMKSNVALHEQLRDQDFVVVMMCLDENSEEVKKRAGEILTKKKCFFPSLMAKDGSSDEAFENYGIEGDALPHYKLYDRKGKLVHSFVSSETESIEHADVVKKVLETLKQE